MCCHVSYYLSPFFPAQDKFHIIVADVVCTLACTFSAMMFRMHGWIAQKNFTSVEVAQMGFQWSQARHLGITDFEETHPFDWGELENLRIILGRSVWTWPLPIRANDDRPGAIVALIAGIWSLVIYVLAVRVVTGFDLLRAFVSVVAPALIVMLIGLLVASTGIASIFDLFW